ncbi:hypothetical protein NHQ30_006896 [Ciborinia camelliae]|nr:hypothetical protein NHQ30_006896 [Ciborinia camelliae]
MDSLSLRQDKNGDGEGKVREVKGSKSPAVQRNPDEGRISPASKTLSDHEASISAPASAEQSIQERKIMCVAEEIDKMGMGKYQWYIWGLCGLGYFLDLVWAHAFGLMAPVMQREMGIDGMWHLSLD